jgi:putative (di)nucleoside polyphosphate hydrolase
MVSGQHFRAGVVIAVTRDDGAVMAFERRDVPGAWQLPQGGLKRGEEPIEAAWRELAEETGLDNMDVAFVREHTEWIVYEYPAHIRDDGPRRGQAQRWFWFKVVSPDVVARPDGDEFTAWRWVERTWLVDNVVDFRRDGYARVLS